jgi:hypothetical protein
VAMVRPQAPWGDGLHTLCAAGSVTVLDGRRGIASGVATTMSFAVGCVVSSREIVCSRGIRSPRRSPPRSLRGGSGVPADSQGWWGFGGHKPGFQAASIHDPRGVNDP